MAISHLNGEHTKEDWNLGGFEQGLSSPPLQSLFLSRGAALQNPQPGSSGSHL